MRRIVILQKEIKDCHPCEKVFSTDSEYAEMAGELATIIREEKLGDMDDELVHHLEHLACLSCHLIYKDRQKALGVWAKVMAWKSAWYSVRWPIAIVLRFMAIGKQAWLNGLAEDTCC